MFTFADDHTRQLAEQLMQPVLIRILDNLRKELEQRAWQGTYHEDFFWPEGTTEAQKARVTELRSHYPTAPPEKTATIEAELAQLPTPFPSYHLQISIADQVYTIDIWQLCFRLCFVGYGQASDTVQINRALFDDTGDIDWLQLDEAAQHLVRQTLEDIDAQASPDPGPVEP